ncbi:MAG: hypothetical protein L3J07_03525 [Candidatus Magasanikbacteria bacterium]|nr:hypothetical protein [Candidatus Magasanikbacteria bacterium]
MPRKGPKQFFSKQFILKKGKVSLGITVNFSIKYKTGEVSSLFFVPFIGIEKEITFNGEKITRFVKLLGKESLEYYYIVEIYRVWRILCLVKGIHIINSPLIVLLEQMLEEKCALKNILNVLPKEVTEVELKRVLVELPKDLEIDTSMYKFGRLSDFVITDPKNKPKFLSVSIPQKSDLSYSYGLNRGLVDITNTGKIKTTNKTTCY